MFRLNGIRCCFLNMIYTPLDLFEIVQSIGCHDRKPWLIKEDTSKIKLIGRVFSTLRCDNSIRMNNSNVIDRNHVSDWNRSYTF